MANWYCWIGLSADSVVEDFDSRGKALVQAKKRGLNAYGINEDTAWEDGDGHWHPDCIVTLYKYQDEDEREIIFDMRTLEVELV